MTNTEAEKQFSRLQLDSIKELSSEDRLKSPPSGGGWRWLADHPEDAAELADLLNEAAPTLGLHTYPRLTPPRTPAGDFFSRHSTALSTTVLLRERLQNAMPIPSGPGQIDWSLLTATITSELLAVEALERESSSGMSAVSTPTTASTKNTSLPVPFTPGGSLVEVNSGGRVLFCLFRPSPSPSHTPSPSLSLSRDRDQDRDREGCLVVKFVPSRLLCQSEQFANELARHVGICSPDSRILRAAAPQDGEWDRALTAARLIAPTHPELLEEMGAASCFLVMEYVPSGGLFRTPDAFTPQATPQTCSDLGRLVILDMLLGNSDRLKCEALGWRGNPENVLCATSGRWEERLVAIDAVVQRRPPGALLSAEDAACERVLELILNDREVAEMVLAEIVSTSADGSVAMQANPAAAVAAFQLGLRRGLEATMGLKGLLEMMFDVVTDWISEFIDDIEGIASSPSSAHPGGTTNTNNSSNGSATMGTNCSTNTASSAPGASSNSNSSSQHQTTSPAITTFKIRRINLQAAHNQSVSEKVGEWKAILARKGQDLSAAVEEWQAKRGAMFCPVDSRGSADDAGHQYRNRPPRDCDNDDEQQKEEEEEGCVGDDNYNYNDNAEEVGNCGSGLTKTRKQGVAGGSSDRYPGPLSSPTMTAYTNATTPSSSSLEEGKGEEGEGEREEAMKRRERALLASLASPRSAATASGVRLTTGFLDGTHPVVDVYELKVRLEHMLQRLRTLQQATASATPTRLFEGLYLSGAVEASSLHLLRYYGITHVLNATEDLLLPEETQSFVGMRIPLRDLEEEEISAYFAPAAAFIDAAIQSGGGVLVHCHAGRSRSCSLVLAWLMMRQHWSLKEALNFLLEKRPQASPNPGYLEQLTALEAELFGKKTVKVKSKKPEPKRCPECGDKIGLSAESVRVHLRLKHPGKVHAYAQEHHARKTTTSSPVKKP